MQTKIYNKIYFQTYFISIYIIIFCTAGIIVFKNCKGNSTYALVLLIFSNFRSVPFILKRMITSDVTIARLT